MNLLLSKSLILAFASAIVATSIFLIWYYPNFVLDIGVEPTGKPLREVYQAQTVADLPDSIQTIMGYQYPLAILLALSIFGAVYFWQKTETLDRLVLVTSCLLPIVSIFWLVPILLAIPVVIGLLIWLIVPQHQTNRQLFFFYCYCFTSNTVSIVVVFLWINDIFAVST
ncbi:MAG: hypothetical protein NW224_11485 [Leptolyngbyaceae cyanobacterium bins.302]|nr:hypothetical protein [Leptolyngbyaceae cyanobacterium bins.302]